MIEVESGIPCPPAKSAQTPLFVQIRDGMRQMLVGSSFFVPCKDALAERYVRSCAFKLRLEVPEFKAWRIATRKVVESGQVGIRVWRNE